jgi:plasmid stabilization system protein ParE
MPSRLGHGVCAADDTQSRSDLLVPGPGLVYAETIALALEVLRLLHDSMDLPRHFQIPDEP